MSNYLKPDKVDAVREEDGPFTDLYGHTELHETLDDFVADAATHMINYYYDDSIVYDLTDMGIKWIRKREVDEDDGFAYEFEWLLETGSPDTDGSFRAYHCKVKESVNEVR